MFSDGNYVAGKTSTLNHLVHYGHCKGYILVNVPWGMSHKLEANRRILQGYKLICYGSICIVPLWTRHFKEIVASTTRPGFYDHTTNAVMWLSHFRSQNSALLAKLEVRIN